MRFMNLSKVGRFVTFVEPQASSLGFVVVIITERQYENERRENDDDDDDDATKTSDQKRVALGVACGLVACAIPFLFKDVQKRELRCHARDGGGGGGERGGFGDGKEEARKERLMTTSKSGEGNVGSNCAVFLSSHLRGE